MKTAISVPDGVFRQADQLARRLKKSRSQLYQEAVAEYIARHDGDRVTEAMNRVAILVGRAPDRFLTGAARRLLKAVEW